MMRGSDDSRQKNQETMDNLPHTPRHVFSREQFEYLKHIFDETEREIDADQDQQHANEQWSGQGETHFDRADVPTSPDLPALRNPTRGLHKSINSLERPQIRFPHDTRTSALLTCHSCIEIFQDIIHEDPSEILVSSSMYCQLSADVLERYHKLFNGN